MLTKVLARWGVVLACAAMVSPAWGTSFAFTGAADRSGDLQGPLAIANDFTVTSSTGINVTQLGLFVDGFDGINGPTEIHTVSLYDRSNTSTPLLTVNIGGSFDAHDGPYAYNNPANSNSPSFQLQGGWVYVNVPSTLLSDGFQGSIVAYNMSDGASYTDDYGESVPFNNGGGLISFTHSFHSSATSGDPTSNSSSEVYGAGSFAFAAAPVPEPAGLSLVILGFALVIRWRRPIEKAAGYHR